MQKKGKNLTDLLDSNRSHVLRYLVKHPGCSRAEIGEETGLTLASLTKIVRSLTESGTVFETGFSEGKKGRRSVGLSFDYEKYKVLAIKIAWNQLEIQPYDFLGNTYGQLVSISFDEFSIHSIDKIINFISNEIENFTKEFKEIVAVGIAIPGPYSRDSGTLLLPPYSAVLEKRHYYPIRDEIAKHTNLPLFIEHDADVGALAYWWFNLNGEKDLVVMNIFTNDGVGIGITDNGSIFTGTSHSSCEMGHITLDYQGRYCQRCGSHGCIDSYCSANALEQIASEQIYKYPESCLCTLSSISAESIIQAALQSDAFAMKLIHECGEYLGYGIHSLLHIFKPDIIVISGTISTGGRILLDSVHSTLSKIPSNYITTPDIRLFPADQKVTLLGAATFAIDRILNSPTHYLSLPSTN